MSINTIEAEHKVLDVDPGALTASLLGIGAVQVYDDVRVITYFDHPDRSLRKAGEGVKLTQESKLKLEYTRKSPSGQSDTVKVFVSRKAEIVEFLERMGLVPITEVHARRISFELGDVDFDIDCFPGIPPFMEIDLADSGMGLDDLLDKLGLSNNEVIVATTPEIFARYGKDYFADFAIAADR